MYRRLYRKRAKKINFTRLRIVGSTRNICAKIDNVNMTIYNKINWKQPQFSII